MIKLFTPDNIQSLKPNEIFVFGSNLLGHHRSGAARVAYNNFGAVWGIGSGLQGQSYAIPTMNGDVQTIKIYVEQFLHVAKLLSNLTFYVTRIGCGIAGFKDSEIAPLFRDVLSLDNVILPKTFVDVLVSCRNNYEDLLLKWEMGLKTVSSVATKHSWRIFPMSENCITIPINLRLPRNQMILLSRGFIPETMDERWFMYCDDSHINYFRSWNGTHVFQAKYVPDESSLGDYRIISLTTSLSAEPKSIALFLSLLSSDCGLNPSLFSSEI